MSEVMDAAANVCPERPLEELAEELCSTAAGIAAATARWLGLVAEFDRREGWAGVGLKSCAHWLAWRCGLSPSAAREHVRVARALTALPAITAAFASGRVSYSTVRALTRIADADNEPDLLEVALAGTAAHVEKIVRGWRRADRLNEPDSDDTSRFGLSVHWDDDGSLRISGRLSAEDGAMLLTALQAAAEAVDAQRAATRSAPAERAERPAAADSTGQRAWRRCSQAEALQEIARAFLDPDPEKRSAASRHQVVVHVDADVLAADAAAGGAHLEGGPALTPEQVARIGCDASLVVMLRRGREVLDVGRSTRTIPAAINRALWARDGGCRFPGCDEGRRGCVQGHHIRFWSRGGRTALANLILLCGYHHRQIHQAGFTVAPDQHGQFVFGDPAGRPLDQRRPQSAWTGSPLPPAEEDLLPLWGGERLDLHHAVWMLLSRRTYRRNHEKPHPAAAA